MKTLYFDKILKKLANLKFAIILLFIIMVVIAIGTVITQDQSIAFYQQNYSETNPLMGIIDWKLILFFNFDHIYSSYWFISLIVLLSAS